VENKSHLSDQNRGGSGGERPGPSGQAEGAAGEPDYKSYFQNSQIRFSGEPARSWVNHQLPSENVMENVSGFSLWSMVYSWGLGLGN
jgi:hypothetical protein